MCREHAKIIHLLVISTVCSVFGTLWAVENRIKDFEIVSVLSVVQAASQEKLVIQKPLNDALTRAMMNDDLVEIQKLLDQGADPNGIRSDLSWPFLYDAMLGKSSKQIKILLNNGAKLLTTGDYIISDFDLFNLAIEINDLDLVDFLITKKLNVNGQSRYLEETPLHQAIMQKRHAMVIALLKAGADVTIKDYRGNTPIDLINDVEIAKLILPNDSEQGGQSEAIPLEKELTVDLVIINDTDGDKKHGAMYFDLKNGLASDQLILIKNGILDDLEIPQGYIYKRVSKDYCLLVPLRLQNKDIGIRYLSLADTKSPLSLQEWQRSHSISTNVALLKALTILHKDVKKITNSSFNIFLTGHGWHDKTAALSIVQDGNQKSEFVQVLEWLNNHINMKSLTLSSCYPGGGKYLKEFNIDNKYVNHALENIAYPIIKQGSFGIVSYAVSASFFTEYFAALHEKLIDYQRLFVLLEGSRPIYNMMSIRLPHTSWWLMGHQLVKQLYEIRPITALTKKEIVVPVGKQYILLQANEVTTIKLDKPVPILPVNYHDQTYYIKNVIVESQPRERNGLFDELPHHADKHIERFIQTMHEMLPVLFSENITISISNITITGISHGPVMIRFGGDYYEPTLIIRWENKKMVWHNRTKYVYGKDDKDTQNYILTVEDKALTESDLLTHATKTLVVGGQDTPVYGKAKNGSVEIKGTVEQVQPLSERVKALVVKHVNIAEKTQALIAKRKKEQKFDSKMVTNSASNG